MLLQFLFLSIVSASQSSVSDDSTITKVVKLLQHMLDKSKEDGASDRKLWAEFKCYCDKETEQKTASVAQATEDIAMYKSEIADYTAQNTKLSQESSELLAGMESIEEARSKAKSIREKENKDFQMTVADQRATQKLLNAALQILKGFYDKKNTTFKDVTLDQQEPAGPPPPPGFKDYSKNKQAGGVQGMIQSIIDDAKAMENEAIVDEENAQKAYEDFIKESNASTEEKQLEATNKKAEKAKSDELLVESTEARDAAIGELETLAEAKAALHQSCDFVMKNFELRQSARDEEIQAMQQAIAILSGAKFDDE